jgi:hypothetical protein
MCPHPFRIGVAAGEDAESVGGLPHGHASAVEHAATLGPGLEHQLGLDRPVDDVGYPVPGFDEGHVQWEARMSGHAHRGAVHQTVGERHELRQLRRRARRDGAAREQGGEFRRPFGAARGVHVHKVQFLDARGK